MIFDGMVTPSVREANQVDKLLKQVKHIRDKCQHDFRLKKAVDLRESKVHGIYIVGAGGNLHRVTIVCIKCSMEKVVVLADGLPSLFRRCRA